MQVFGSVYACLSVDAIVCIHACVTRIWLYTWLYSIFTFRHEAFKSPYPTKQQQRRRTPQDIGSFHLLIKFSYRTIRNFLWTRRLWTRQGNRSYRCYPIEPVGTLRCRSQDWCWPPVACVVMEPHASNMWDVQCGCTVCCARCSLQTSWRRCEAKRLETRTVEDKNKNHHHQRQFAGKLVRR